MKKILFALLAATMFIGCQEKKDDNVIRIACNLPMTGDISFYGQYIKDGINLALSELQDSLQYHNIKMEFLYEDNHSTARDAVSAFNRHALSDFDIYISSCTAQSLAIKDLVYQKNVPHFIWSFYPLTLSNDDNLFRVWIDMAYEGKKFVEYILDENVNSVAFVYQNLSSTDEQFNLHIGPQLEASGINIVYNEAYDTSKKDFKDVSSKLKSLNPDIVILYGFQNQLAEIIKGLNANGFKKDGNILCSFDFMDVLNILDKDLLDGIVTNIPDFEINNTAKNKQWRVDFKKIYGREPLFTDAYAYDFTYVLYEAIKLTRTSGLRIEDAIKKVDISGITGPLYFDTTGQIGNNIKTCIFKNGVYNEL